MTPRFAPRSSPKAAVVTTFEYPNSANLSLPLFEEHNSTCEGAVVIETYSVTETDYVLMSGSPVGSVILDETEVAALAGSDVFIPALRDALVAKWQAMQIPPPPMPTGFPAPSEP